MYLKLLHKIRKSERMPLYQWVRTVFLVVVISWVVYSWTLVEQKKSECEYVRMLYQVVLFREADTGGLKTHCTALQTGTMTKKQLLEAFLASPEYKSQR